MLATRARCQKDARPVVKSAARVLEVVEYLSHNSDGVTATELVKELGYPASSTSALLKSLSALGYVSFDRRRRTYHPTARVALIGARTLPDLFGDGQLLKVMQEVNEETGEMAILAMEVASQVRFIHATEGPGNERLHLRSEGLRSLVTSCSGRLFLSTLSDTQIRCIAHRHNCEASAPENRMNIDELLHEVRDIRDRKYCVLVSRYRPGVAGVAVLVPQQESHAKLALVIAGLVNRVMTNHCEYARIMRTALSRHLP